MILWLAALAIASAAALCEPAPPPDDLPPRAEGVCKGSEIPTPSKLRGDVAGACGTVHRHILAATARAWDDDLEPHRGRLMGPLTKAAPEARVLSLWNQDALGKRACDRSPQMLVCNPEEREAWLPRLYKEDLATTARARELYTWFLQTRKACQETQGGGGAEALKKFKGNAGRFSAELEKLLETAADVEAFRGMKADYGSRLFDVSALESWGAAIEEWTEPLEKLMPKRTSAAKGPPKARRKAADTAPPD